MCRPNHALFARPGYLIDAPCESVAANGAVFTRMLAHHREVGLSPEQITDLLDVSREYHERQVAIRLEMAALGEQVEIKFGRVDDAALAARTVALARRAELFHLDELNFFHAAQRGDEVLSDEQILAAEKIYHAEKDAGLGALAGALNNAVGPNYVFALA